MDTMIKSFLVRAMGLIFILTSAVSVQAQDIDYPDWFIMPPVSDEEYTFATASSRADNSDEARNEAVNLTMFYLTEELATKVEILYMMYVEETNDEEIFPAFARVREFVAESSPKAAEIYDEHSITDEEGMTQVFILVRMPQEEALQHVIGKIQMDEAVYSKLQDTETFEQFKRDFARYGY